MKKFPYLIFGTILFLIASESEGKSILKEDNGGNDGGLDKSTADGATDTNAKTIKVKPLTSEELNALFDQVDAMSKTDDSSKTKAKAADIWGQDNSFNWNRDDLFDNSYKNPIIPDKPDVSSKIFDDFKAQQDSMDALRKTMKDLDKYSDTLSSNNYNYNDYKAPEYTSTYSYSGVNGYHISGGFMVVALILVFIRCCLICCRYQVQNENRARSIILVRETPVHALIISRRHRSNSKDDLMENAELPADDPPTYEDCTREPTAANPGALPDYVQLPPPIEEGRNRNEELTHA